METKTALNLNEEEINAITEKVLLAMSVFMLQLFDAKRKDIDVTLPENRDDFFKKSVTLLQRLLEDEYTITDTEAFDQMVTFFEKAMLLGTLTGSENMDTERMLISRFVKEGAPKCLERKDPQ